VQANVHNPIGYGHPLISAVQSASLEKPEQSAAELRLKRRMETAHGMDEVAIS
jgi:hypothetical protein